MVERDSLGRELLPLTPVLRLTASREDVILPVHEAAWRRAESRLAEERRLEELVTRRLATLERVLTPKNEKRSNKADKASAQRGRRHAAKVNRVLGALPPPPSVERYRARLAASKKKAIPHAEEEEEPVLFERVDVERVDVARKLPAFFVTELGDSLELFAARRKNLQGGGEEALVVVELDDDNNDDDCAPRVEEKEEMAAAKGTVVAGGGSIAVRARRAAKRREVEERKVARVAARHDRRDGRLRARAWMERVAVVAFAEGLRARLVASRAERRVATAHATLARLYRRVLRSRSFGRVFPWRRGAVPLRAVLWLRIFRKRLALRRLRWFLRYSAPSGALRRARRRLLGLAKRIQRAWRAYSACTHARLLALRRLWDAAAQPAANNNFSVICCVITPPDSPVTAAADLTPLHHHDDENKAPAPIMGDRTTMGAAETGFHLLDDDDDDDDDQPGAQETAKRRPSLKDRRAVWTLRRLAMQEAACSLVASRRRAQGDRADEARWGSIDARMRHILRPKASCGTKTNARTGRVGGRGPAAAKKKKKKKKEKEKEKPHDGGGSGGDEDTVGAALSLRRWSSASAKTIATTTAVISTQAIDASLRGLLAEVRKDHAARWASAHDRHKARHDRSRRFSVDDVKALLAIDEPTRAARPLPAPPPKRRENPTLAFFLRPAAASPPDHRDEPHSTDAAHAPPKIKSSSRTQQPRRAPPTRRPWALSDRVEALIADLRAKQEDILTYSENDSTTYCASALRRRFPRSRASLDSLSDVHSVSTATSSVSSSSLL